MIHRTRFRVEGSKCSSQKTTMRKSCCILLEPTVLNSCGCESFQHQVTHGRFSLTITHLFGVVEERVSIYDYATASKQAGPPSIDLPAVTS